MIFVVIRIQHGADCCGIFALLSCSHQSRRECWTTAITIGMKVTSTSMPNTRASLLWPELGRGPHIHTHTLACMVTNLEAVFTCSKLFGITRHGGDRRGQGLTREKETLDEREYNRPDVTNTLHNSFLDPIKVKHTNVANLRAEEEIEEKATIFFRCSAFFSVVIDQLRCLSYYADKQRCGRKEIKNALLVVRWRFL